LTGIPRGIHIRRQVHAASSGLDLQRHMVKNLG
jgi:hypothetical protein